MTPDADTYCATIFAADVADDPKATASYVEVMIAASGSSFRYRLVGIFVIWELFATY